MSAVTRRETKKEEEEKVKGEVGSNTEQLSLNHGAEVVSSKGFLG